MSHWEQWSGEIEIAKAESKKPPPKAMKKYDTAPFKIEVSSANITHEKLDEFIRQQRGEHWMGSCTAEDERWLVGFSDEFDVRLFQQLFGK